MSGKVREADPGESMCFREADVVDGRGRKNDLETALRKETTSFLNNKNFCIIKYTRHKV